MSTMVGCSSSSGSAASLPLASFPCGGMGAATIRACNFALALRLASARSSSCALSSSLFVLRTADVVRPAVSVSAVAAAGNTGAARFSHLLRLYT